MCFPYSIFGQVSRNSLDLTNSVDMENQITSSSEDQNILSRFEEVLRRPDYILEPGCWATIVEYIKAGGKPEQLVESLSDSYVGQYIIWIDTGHALMQDMHAYGTGLRMMSLTALLIIVPIG